MHIVLSYYNASCVYANFTKKKKEFDLKLKLYVCILKTSVQIYLGHKNIKIFFDCL